jgi:hypothetical protein
MTEGGSGEGRGVHNCCKEVSKIIEEWSTFAFPHEKVCLQRAFLFKRSLQILPLWILLTFLLKALTWKRSIIDLEKIFK